MGVTPLLRPAASDAIQDDAPARAVLKDAGEAQMHHFEVHQMCMMQQTSC